MTSWWYAKSRFHAHSATRDPGSSSSPSCARGRRQRRRSRNRRQRRRPRSLCPRRRGDDEADDEFILAVDAEVLWAQLGADHADESLGGADVEPKASSTDPLLKSRRPEPRRRRRHAPNHRRRRRAGRRRRRRRNARFRRRRQGDLPTPAGSRAPLCLTSTWPDHTRSTAHLASGCLTPAAWICTRHHHRILQTARTYLCCIRAVDATCTNMYWLSSQRSAESVPIR
jgi:hypothetical protein